MVKIEYRDLGLIRYGEALEYQKGLFEEMIRLKMNNQTKRSPSPEMNYLIFCEHPPVFTLGKSGSENNLLINESLLRKMGIEFYRINRGGDITYHGPGQIVGYPIIDLEQFGLGIKDYIFLLEEAVIVLLQEYGITAGRLDMATGVWLETDSRSNARKICAIGVRASHYITMHGFAFNINTDLSYYQHIHPCGIKDKGITSMEKELGDKVNMNKVKRRLKLILTKLLID